MPCIKSIKISGLQILVMLCYDVRNSVAYKWENLSGFTQNCDLNVVLGSYDK